MCFRAALRGQPQSVGTCSGEDRGGEVGGVHDGVGGPQQPRLAQSKIVRIVTRKVNFKFLLARRRASGSKPACDPIGRSRVEGIQWTTLCERLVERAASGGGVGPASAHGLTGV